MLALASRLFQFSPLEACTLPAFPDGDGEFDGLSFGLAHGDEMQANAKAASRVVREVFQELEVLCLEEKEQYSRSGQRPSVCKQNRWAVYTDPAVRKLWATKAMHFIRGYPDCRAKRLADSQLRFLVLLQHLVALDIRDFYRPEAERQHADAFEGVITINGVNSQLVKDAHRSEWSIEGRTYLVKESEVHETMEDRKEVIASFQRDLVSALESFLLAFCGRRGLSEVATIRFLQAVTTQMSQCGLANLDRSSSAGKYFVSGQGLEQRITYNVSSMDAGPPMGEALKLSLLCMKTGFGQYHKAESLADVDCDGPLHCSPKSYLYQYATLRFVPVAEDPITLVDNNALRVLCVEDLGPKEHVQCVVIDALDEVHIIPEESS